jgi:hypothetical protein
MKQLVLVALGCGLALILMLFILAFAYLKIDYRTFDLLSSQPNGIELENLVRKQFSIINVTQKLEEEGWPLPSYVPKGTKEIWIFDNRTGRRFYVFVDVPERPILGFFSSSS